MSIITDYQVGYEYRYVYFFRHTSIFATDGGWHHICATWENTAGSWELYKDGVVAAHGQGLKTGTKQPYFYWVYKSIWPDCVFYC